MPHADSKIDTSSRRNFRQDRSDLFAPAQSDLSQRRQTSSWGTSSADNRRRIPLIVRSTPAQRCPQFRIPELSARSIEQLRVQWSSSRSNRETSRGVLVSPFRVRSQQDRTSEAETGGRRRYRVDCESSAPHVPARFALTHARTMLGSVRQRNITSNTSRRPRNERPEARAGTQAYSITPPNSRREVPDPATRLIPQWLPGECAANPRAPGMSGLTTGFGNHAVNSLPIAFESI